MNLAEQEIKKVKPKLDPNASTVLIGFKGSEVLKKDLEDCASSLGLSYSQLLRANAQECVEKIKKIKEGFDK